MSLYPTAKELAEEAIRALEADTMTPEEHIEFLIARGIIDRQGRVLCNRLFGGDEAQPDAAPLTSNGTATPPTTNGAATPNPLEPADKTP